MITKPWPILNLLRGVGTTSRFRLAIGLKFNAVNTVTVKVQLVFLYLSVLMHLRNI